MKTNTWTTILAIVVLLLVGIYTLRTRPDTTLDSEPTTYTEVINGEEVTLNYPLVESFSNPTSNSLVARSKATNNTSRNTTFVSNVVAAVAKPFTLGFYYFDNIKKKGLENCNGRDITGESEALEFPEYTEENFRLTSIDVHDRAAYLYVDADESPEGLCAYITQYETITNDLLDAIHVVVN